MVEPARLLSRLRIGATATAALLALATAQPARAQATGCGGLFALAYPSGQPFAVAGDVYRVRVRLGTSSIEGGTANELTVQRFRFALDCAGGGNVPCSDEGDIVRYVGDGTITSMGCVDADGFAVGWTSDGADSAAGPNEVVFTPGAPVVIPTNTPPSVGCEIQFDVRIETTPGADASPLTVQQAVGFAFGDALCDQDPPLASVSGQTGQIRLCPACADGECFDQACNPTTGVCEQTDEQAGTECTDTDGDACTIAGCDGQGACVQSHAEVVCDDPECQACDPATGACVDQDPLPALCAPPPGCRVTAGGVAPAAPGQPSRGAAYGRGEHASFGGEVGAPCGCVGCFDELDAVQGQWTHFRKRGGERFRASEFSSLACDLDGRDGPVWLAAANRVCFAGKGLLAESGGRRVIPVAFRVDAEDRGPPGMGKRPPSGVDLYRMRIWIPRPGEEPEDFFAAICCRNAEVAGAGLPDIDDWSVVERGDVRIHPLPPATEGSCPRAEDVGACSQDASGG